MATATIATIELAKVEALEGLAPTGTATVLEASTLTQEPTKDSISGVEATNRVRPLEAKNEFERGLRPTSSIDRRHARALVRDRHARRASETAGARRVPKEFKRCVSGSRANGFAVFRVGGGNENRSVGTGKGGQLLASWR